MAESKVYRAHSIQEIQKILKASKTAIPVSGATSFSVNGDDKCLNIGDEILALSSVPELKMIHKSERYIDFGSCVSLDEIILRGKKHVPAVLYEALTRAGNVAIRGVATIGGNLAMKNPFTASFLPLLALDAQCEVCTDRELFWLASSKYLTDDSFDERMVLTRIRIRDEEWTHYVYKKIKNGQYMDEIPAFLFLAKVQKNIISDAQFLFADKCLVRAKEFDSLVVGRSLPISKEHIADILSKAHDIFPPTLFSSVFNKKCFFNLIEKTLYVL